MPLLERIKEVRGRRPGKEPWPLTAFTAVAAIVRASGLTSVAQLAAAFPGDQTPPGRERLSLFPLLSAGQYHLVQEIIRRYDNPYLGYARTPVDIVISHRLYLCRPDLDQVILATTPLAELWAREKADLQEP